MGKGRGGGGRREGQGRPPNVRDALTPLAQEENILYMYGMVLFSVTLTCVARVCQHQLSLLFCDVLIRYSLIA